MFVGYWTQWYDRDTPRLGIGDVETIAAIENQGSPVCDEQYSPLGTECRTHVFEEWLVFRERDAYLAPDKLYNPCTKTGLECRNRDQPMEATCRDYQIRFYCVLSGKDTKTEDNSSMIALAAGLTFLFPIVIALAINVFKRYCCKQQTPIVSRDGLSMEPNQQPMFDPPPSYNVLFGQSQTIPSSEGFSGSPSVSTQNNQTQINIHTLPSSNMLIPANTISNSTDNHSRLYRDRMKRLPGMHLSVIDMYNHYCDSNSTPTPPPSYTDALVIISTFSTKPEQSATTTTKTEQSDQDKDV